MDKPRTAADLNRRRAIQLAEISGAGQRWAFGAGKDRPRSEALAELFEISRDPVLYGLALGAALAELEEQPAWGPALVELYRLAGADEQVAAANLEWQRSRPTFSRPVEQ